MPVEGNVYAAFVTEMEEMLQLDGNTSFLTFPQTLVRLGLFDLLFSTQEVQEHSNLDAAQAQLEALRNNEAFSVLANQIPRAAGPFEIDGRMLWSIYERVLGAKQFVTGAADEDLLRTAQLFQAADTKFLLARRGSNLNGNPYRATGILPPSDVTDADGWTRITLDRESIEQRSRESSPATQAWLKQRDLLDAIEKAGVRAISLSAEIFPLTPDRPWLEPEVFSNRFWHWDDAPLSDGGDPPHGLLPAYVTRLILVRHLQIELDVAPSAQPSGGMAAFAPGVPPVVLAALAPSVVSTNASPQPPTLHALAPDKSRSLNLLQFVKAAPGGPPAASDPLAFGVSTLGGMVVAFPAPTNFLTRRVIDRIAAERGNVANRVAQLSAERSILEQDLASQEVQVRRMEKEVNQWPADVNIAVITDPSTHPPTVSEYDVAGARAYLTGLREYLAHLQEKAAQLEQALALQNKYDRDLDEQRRYYEGLPHPSDETDIFILCVVCSATPKSPNPDTAVFT
ncbi:MAG TPA: hypothetical protein VJ306_01650 [Pyrinomonadaceae bacterium]|nr:hypothetical protein [Pyrinomonadaceae bacterium]